VGYAVTPYVGYFPLRPVMFTSTATTQVVGGLTNGVTYRFRVRAVTAVATSAYSKVTNPVTPLPAYFVVFDGQSLNFFGGYPAKLMAAHPGVPYRNAWSSGCSWTVLATTQAERTFPFAHAGQRTILIMNGGTSDLVNERDDGATLYADERSYAEQARAAGFDEVIITTTTPAEGFSPLVDANRLVANHLVVANADSAFDYTVDFDVDLSPELSLHDSSDVAAYPDGVHWSPAAAQVAADLVDAQLSRIIVPATVPGAPTIGSATAGDGQATVSWSAPASDGGSPVTGYVVTPYIGYFPLAPVTFASNATTQVATGLTNGTTYRFRVQAINAVGTGAHSTVSNPVTPTR
jgi:hypothetical protein